MDTNLETRALDPQARAVLDFWFGAPGDAEHGQIRTLWFRASDAVDAQIRERFGALVERALQGDLSGSGWNAEQPAAALARILVLDQFTRNIFRGTPKAFAGDAPALATATALVESGRHERLAPTRRWFAYMPFEHAESLEMQDEALRLFTRLFAEAPETKEALDYARRHRDVIARFGRFPHRNAILGRPSTDAELAFLQQPGSRF